MTNEDAMKNIKVLHCGDYDCQLPENEADDVDFWCNSTACAGCFHFLCYTALREQAEIVKCKNCIYQKDAKVNCKGFVICPASNMEITDDDYCSYGKRRESEVSE